MNGYQRMMAAMRGEAVDRVLLWLREGFDFLDPFPPADDFRNGWRADPLYHELFELVKPRADVILRWHNGFDNRFLSIPGKYVSTRKENVSADVRRTYGTIQTPRGELHFVDEERRGEDTNWHIEHAVKSLDDLRALAEIPFEISPTAVKNAIARYHAAREKLGDKGILRTDFPSPIVAISGCMDFQNFLELSILEQDLFHELLDKITGRIEQVIEALFGGDERLDTIVNFGGSEQCTPPMMAPQSFDEFVVPYDSRLVKKLHSYGILCNCHCHSSVKHALSGMVEAGYDSTDPVEPPPQGDVTWAEAKNIVGDRLNLFGNLEWTELESAEPEHIKKRVREILSTGKTRTVVSASAGPISKVSHKLVENYRALIEELQ